MWNMPWWWWNQVEASMECNELLGGGFWLLETPRFLSARVLPHF